MSDVTSEEGVAMMVEGDVATRVWLMPNLGDATGVRVPKKATGSL